MKILFSPCHYIYDEFYGGSEQSWAYNIADRISKKHPKSVVVTGFKKTKSEKYYKIIEIQKNKKELDMSYLNAFIFNYLFTKKNNLLLKTCKFDIIHHILPFGLFRTYNLTKTKNTPFIVGPLQANLDKYDTDRSAKNMRGNKKNFYPIFLVANLIFKISKPIIKKLSIITLKRASKIIVITEDLKQYLTRYGFNPNKIEVIPPGIDTKKFQSIPFENKNQNNKELLVVCYLVKRKQVDLIIKAFHQVLKKDRNVNLRIIGDGPQKQKLIQLANDLNIIHKVTFMGFIPNDQISQFYQNAHLFISMSKSESYGQMYLEALSSGLPIISLKNKGSKEIIKKKFGVLLSNPDINNLADKILLLTSNQDKLKILSRNARKEAERRFDWDNCIIPKYLNIYESET